MFIRSKTLRFSAFFMAGIILLSSCASTTRIQSHPDGAKLYLNGESVGTTPYDHTDTKIVGSVTTVRLEKEGYETLNTSFARNEEADVGAIIGGIFVWIPFLWTMKYKSSRTYELIPLAGNSESPAITDKESDYSRVKSKAEALREIKQLLDEEIITPEEYEAEKKKILDRKD